MGRARDVVPAAWVDSVLAGVLAVGGEGLDLGDRQVDGVGGGDCGQVAAGAVGGGVGGRVGHGHRQRGRAA